MRHLKFIVLILMVLGCEPSASDPTQTQVQGVSTSPSVQRKFKVIGKILEKDVAEITRVIYQSESEDSFAISYIGHLEKSGSVFVETRNQMGGYGYHYFLNKHDAQWRIEAKSSYFACGIDPK